MLRGRHKHIFKSQWYFLLSSQLLFLGPFVFHGPFVLESIGLLVKPTVAASLIGSFLVMLTSLVGVPLIVDRFGARKMALISVFALSISQFSFCAIFAKDVHHLSSKSSKVAVGLLVITYITNSMAKGLLGSLPFRFHQREERAGRGILTVTEFILSASANMTFPLLLCSFEKHVFIILGVSSIVFLLIILGRYF
ncbi:unnamed protein product [Cuscuta epithymum]|uniref:Major facilitator superfamily (MFS) profile domain-containing protein n=1 Tax=Cuscuta epithymum TaxID=186058 RepID=A0AAV0CJ95_9ASTE|nr:unnamed protein product [Cuscuta epithymum]